MRSLHDFDREELLAFIEDLAKRWLAHDGLWFQAVERAYGLEAALAVDAEVWEQFSALEAARIKRILGLPDTGGGLEALEQALRFRLYAFLNRQESVREAPDRLVFRMTECRVQAARRRKQLAPFPCKQVGLVEYRSFARAIDPRIETRCLQCPPDPVIPGCFCAWGFTLPS